MKKLYISPRIEVSQIPPKYSIMESSGIVGGGSSRVKQNYSEEFAESEEQGWSNDFQKSIW